MTSSTNRLTFLSACSIFGCRCFYNDFFRRNDELDLVGPIFCAADLRLFEGAAGLGEGDLKEGTGGAKVRLDTTLVGGARSCHFVIERTRQ